MPDTAPAPSRAAQRALANNPAFLVEVGGVHVARERWERPDLPNAYTMGVPWGHEGRGRQLLGHLRFQTGDPADVGRNGVTEEAVVAVLIDRLRGQEGQAVQDALAGLREARKALARRPQPVSSPRARPATG